MQRDEQDAGIGPERGLRPVAMMDVPIEDEDALRAVSALRLSCRDDGVVEDAESHPLVRHGMVTGRPDQGVRRVDGTGHHGVDRGDRAPSGEPRDAISASPDWSARAGVSAVGLAQSRPPARDAPACDRRVSCSSEATIRFDALHALRDPEQIHEVLRAADQRRARRMRDWFGEGVRNSILDQIETGVMREIAVIEDKTDEPVSWHG